MVAFSWVEWPDKATRDAAMKKMMEDPRMEPSTPGNPPMPFTANECSLAASNSGSK
jgi:uncharacterized protein YbaA (DUF1428 family)